MIRELRGALPTPVKEALKRRIYPPLLAEGETVPEWHLQSWDGSWHRHNNRKWTVMVFYPMDDTPGCTKEACAFRDNIFAFEKLNAIVLGVSLDNVESHAEFAEKYSLPFSILADSEKQAASAYGVVMKIGPMELASRQSFLIDPEGNIVKHYAKVNAEKHSEEVLVDLGELTGEGKESDS